MIIESIYQTIIDQYRITTRPSQRNHKRRRPGTIGPVEKSLTAPVQCYRLLCSRHHLSPSQLREPRIFDIERQLKFISTVNSNDGEKTIAVSDLNTGEDNRYCELSVSVESPWQHKGLAEILCKKLLEFSQHRGMKFFYSDDEQQIQQLAVNSGFDRATNKEDGLQQLYCLPAHNSILTNEQDMRFIPQENPDTAKPLQNT